MEKVAAFFASLDRNFELAEEIAEATEEAEAIEPAVVEHNSILLDGTGSIGAHGSGGSLYVAAAGDPSASVATRAEETPLLPRSQRSGGSNGKPTYGRAAQRAG